MKVYFIEVGVLIKNHEEEFDKYIKELEMKNRWKNRGIR